MRRALAILLLCLAPLLAACGGEKKEAAAQPPPPKRSSKSTGACKRVSAPRPKGEGHRKRPRRALDPRKAWKLVVETNCGSFTIALDVEKAPNTAASLVALARSGFYDGTVFHRIVPNFVIQGGDPTATGNGGPGYSTIDRPPGTVRYTRGVVAMAKTQEAPAGTAGSQFFVVTGADSGLLPDYAYVGRVSKGLDVVERIGRLGDPSSEHPTQPVVIAHVAVQRG